MQGHFSSTALRVLQKCFCQGSTALQVYQRLCTQPRKLLCVFALARLGTLQEPTTRMCAQQRKPLHVSSSHTEAWHPGSPDCQDGARSSASHLMCHCSY